MLAALKHLGYQLFRFILLFLIHLLLTIVVTAICFVLIPTNGDYVGIALAQLWTLGVMTLGDRLILSTLKAKRLGQSMSLSQKVSNFRAINRFERSVDVFISHEVTDNVVILDSYFRSPAIVIGAQLSTSVRENDLDQIVKLAIDRIQTKHWSFASLCVQLLSLMALPTIIVTLIPKTKNIASLCSAPANFITDIFLKLGGVRLEEHEFLPLQSTYPNLWGAPKLRLPKSVSTVVGLIIERFLLIAPVQSTLLTRLREDVRLQEWENV